MKQLFIEIDEKLKFLLNSGTKLSNGHGEVLYYFGSVINPENALEQIRHNVCHHKALYHGIYGNYTILYRDEWGKWRIFQDLMGGQMFLYYTREGSKAYLSSSVCLLRDHLGKLVFNDAVADEFIYNGVLRGPHTLMCGVYKLLPQEFIYIEGGQIHIERMEVAFQKGEVYTTEELFTHEQIIICEYIEKMRSCGGRYAALSGGYDSNLLVHLLNRESDSVTTFSCGGARGADETKSAQKICGHYANASLQIGKVDSQTLRKLPALVEILEGSLYERGIFLQYVLAEMVSKAGARSILLGECADQIFNVNMYRERSDAFLMDYIHHPYELGSLLVLKKSNLIFNAFGVCGLYPFVDERMIALAYITRKQNGVSKEYQKQMCTAVFHPRVSEYIKKDPGSTSLCALFDSVEAEEAFMISVRENNEFYRPDFRISMKYGERESELDYYLCLEYLKLFKAQFCN